MGGFDDDEPHAQNTSYTGTSRSIRQPSFGGDYVGLQGLDTMRSMPTFSFNNDDEKDGGVAPKDALKGQISFGSAGFQGQGFDAMPSFSKDGDAPKGTLNFTDPEDDKVNSTSGIDMFNNFSIGPDGKIIDTRGGATAGDTGTMVPKSGPKFRSSGQVKKNQVPPPEEKQNQQKQTTSTDMWTSASGLMKRLFKFEGELSPVKIGLGIGAAALVTAGGYAAMSGNSTSDPYEQE